MSEIKNVGYIWMAKCNQLKALRFKGLMSLLSGRSVVSIGLRLG